MSAHLTTTEPVPVLRSVAVCSCGWRGKPQSFLEWAEADGRDHEADPAAPAKEDPLMAHMRQALAPKEPTP